MLGCLEGNNKAFVVACDGCSTGCKSSDAEHAAEMVAELEKSRKSVTGTARVEMACNQGLMALMLMQQMAEAGAKDKAAKEHGKNADHRAKRSIEIATRLIRGPKPLCWGLHIMPLGRGHRVPVGLEAAGLQDQG